MKLWHKSPNNLIIDLLACEAFFIEKTSRIKVFAKQGKNDWCLAEFDMLGMEDAKSYINEIFQSIKDICK